MTNDAPRTSPSPQLPLADRYRVLARVGVGGTAVVYRCVDLHTERIVAVKVLRTTGPMIPEAAARFGREARLAATLTHSNIVRVLDYGYTIPLASASRAPWVEDVDRQVPSFTMEYVFGSSLKELLRRYGPLPFDWVWRLGDQFCSALATAHAAGVVHRDVKPQNVMIVDSRIELLSKLADFGIARQVGGDLTTLTVTGQLLGTPDYLSPEQVMGEPGGPSSDLYALGIVLFELITGRLPFEADTPLAARPGAWWPIRPCSLHTGGMSLQSCRRSCCWRCAASPANVLPTRSSSRRRCGGVGNERPRSLPASAARGCSKRGHHALPVFPLSVYPLTTPWPPRRRMKSINLPCCASHLDLAPNSSTTHSEPPARATSMAPIFNLPYWTTQRHQITTIPSPAQKPTITLHLALATDV